MKSLLAVLTLLLSACAAAPSNSEDDAERAQQWLQQLVGEWDSEAEVWAEPGSAPQRHRSRDSVRVFGSWIVSEGETILEGTPYQVLMTLGYDQERGEIVGTWIDTFQNHLWIYEGILDDSGKVLTLETEGPSPENPKKTSRYREELEMRGADLREHRAYVLRDGEWIRIVRITSRRRQ